MQNPNHNAHGQATINHTILVVEDEKSVLENIIELLEAEGFRTVSARNGEEAYDLVAEVKPDLIISDIRMPRLDGKGLLSRLSHTRAGRNIPFIFLTALSDRADFRAGMELGADDYITKPFTRKDLLGAVFRRLQKHKRIQSEAIEGSLSSQSNLSMAIPYEMLQPLTQIRLLAEQLERMRGSANGEEIYQSAHSISLAVEKLMRNVSNYLLLNELGKSRDLTALTDLTDLEPVSLLPVLNELVRSVFWEFDRSGDLHFDLQDGWVAVSETNLARIVEELARYALANSHPGQSVIISGLPLSNNGIYCLTIAGPRGNLRPEQLIWMEKQESLPLSETMQMGMGLLLAWKLAQIGGIGLHIASRPNDYVSVELSIPLATRSIA